MDNHSLRSSHRGLHLVAVDLVLKVTQFDICCYIPFKQVDNQSLRSSHRELRLAAVDLVLLSLIRVVLSVSKYHSNRWPTTLQGAVTEGYTRWQWISCSK